MAKKNAPVLTPVYLTATVAGQEHFAGKVTQTENGYSVASRIPRRRQLEVTEIPNEQVIAAVTGDEGFIVARSNAVAVVSMEVASATRTAVEGGFQYETAEGQLVYIAAGVEVSMTSEVEDGEEAPAKKAPAKKAPAKGKKAVVEEDDEDEDDEEEEEEEDEDDEEEEDEDEDEDDEDDEDEDDEDEDEDDEDEVPAKGKKGGKAPAKGKAPVKGKAPAKGKKKGGDFDF